MFYNILQEPVRVADTRVEMSNITDKLDKAKAALQYCIDVHPASGIIRDALAEFPDPDAVGFLVERGTHNHETMCTKLLSREVLSEVKPCSCGHDAALAKLEEKP